MMTSNNTYMRDAETLGARTCERSERGGPGVAPRMTSQGVVPPTPSEAR